jgi:hypothetical protein
MVMICYNEAIDEEVMEILEACAHSNYTKIIGVFGKWMGSGMHLGNDVWPGRNNVLYAACDDDSAARLIEGIRGLRKEYRHEGIKAFSWKIEETT